MQLERHPRHDGPGGFRAACARQSGVTKSVTKFDGRARGDTCLGNGEAPGRVWEISGERFQRKVPVLSRLVRASGEARRRGARARGAESSPGARRETAEDGGREGCFFFLLSISGGVPSLSRPATVKIHFLLFTFSFFLKQMNAPGTNPVERHALRNLVGVSHVVCDFQETDKFSFASPRRREPLLLG